MIEINFKISIPLKSSDKNSSSILNNQFHIKKDEDISVNLILENLTNSHYANLKLNIISNENFKFIAGSLINASNNKPFICEDTKNGTFYIDEIKKGENIKLHFFVKSTLNNIDFENLNIPISFLNIYIEDDLINEISRNNIFIIEECPISITSSLGCINVENIGTIPCKNIIYEESLPPKCKIDESSISATYNGKTYDTITFKKIYNTLLFNIFTLSPNTKDNKNKLVIKYNYTIIDTPLKISKLKIK